MCSRSHHWNLLHTEGELLRDGSRKKKYTAGTAILEVRPDLETSNDFKVKLSKYLAVLSIWNPVEVQLN